MNIVSKSTTIAGRELILEVGRFAEQANAAVLARYGDTMVIATVVSSEKESTLDYFPLSVEYVERLYAGGRIKGSRWVKREGKPTDDAILTARLIDRSIRPLFDKNFRRDVQVVVTVLSVDGENEPEMLSIIATSAALTISSIPFNGPIGSVRVGYVSPANGDQGHFVNPGSKQIEFSELDLVVSSTKEKVVMIEAGANELPEKVLLDGIVFAQTEIDNIIRCIEELAKEAGKKKLEITESEDHKEVVTQIEKKYSKKLKSSLDNQIKSILEKESSSAISNLADEIFDENSDSMDKKVITKALDYLFKNRVRQDILKNGKRVDGRGNDEIRPVSGAVNFLPRTHGNAMFQRGQTQVLTVATLGSPSLEQIIENPEGETVKRYMHHYSMPPYSVGETGRIGFPKRREVGHGALAERALVPVIPSQEAFPYTIRLVSEVMSSNGSTSMASVCGSTLALMDAGVPISNPVAGISIGLVTEGKKNVLLTDIIGLEDFFGDMDFKVAGTIKGITAIQLDIKIDGITHDLIRETLSKALLARTKILEVMHEILPSPRTNLSQYAPKVVVVMVKKDKIGEVIGPGGKVIRQIIAETESDVNVDDDGKVTISGTDPEKVELARKWIEGIIKEVNPGEVYEGLVKRILPFGVFVEILPGREGMVHVSQLSDSYVSDPATVVSIDDRVKVKVIEIDDQGRINLTMNLNKDISDRPRPSGGNHHRPQRGRFNRGRNR